MSRLRVIIADDHSEIRRGVAEMLAAEYEVVASVENGQQLVETAMLLDPDILIIDGSMPVVNGLDALRRLRERGLEAKAVMLTVSDNSAFVRRAFQSGASAYVVKARASEDLPKALKAALAGENFISESIAKAMASSELGAIQRRSNG